MGKKKTILVAPLNWGLGHATRCIPIIQELLKNNFNVIIASDGIALKILQKEFPTLDYITLPSYGISYPKKGKLLKWKLFLKLPSIKKAISLEKNIIQKLVSENKIHGIISDNRFGLRNSNIPSVYITHQLKVLSGNTSFLTSKIHQNIINKFNECWVPDLEGENNLSGDLSKNIKLKTPIKFIGPLSRFKKENVKKKYDILILLSGPEPQRSILESKLFYQFKDESKEIIFVLGIVEQKQKVTKLSSNTIYNFMLANELETAINESNLVIARSGYSTIMDLAILEKKAFFIPTPGQFEQEYLANYFQKKKWAPYCNQEDFLKDKIEKSINYQGLKLKDTNTNFRDLFSLFKSK